MLMTKHLTKPIRAIHFMVLAFLMTLSSPVAAQDFQKGFAAAQAGDYATALQEWKPLAEAGDEVLNTILVSCTTMAKAFLKTTKKL